jgi:Tfp pilus assembly protein PilP
MMRGHSFPAGIACLCLLFLLAGADCSRAAEVKPVVPAAPPSTPGPGTAAAPAAAPVPVPVIPYVYRPTGKADPFQPFIETELAIKKKTDMEQMKKPGMRGRSISPLLQADITQFRLAGIAGSDKKRVAVVEYVTTKKFYPLFEGTYIGTNEGRVAEIRPDRVIVEERFDDQAKKSRKAKLSRTPMMLHKDEEEGKP